MEIKRARQTNKVILSVKQTSLCVCVRLFSDHLQCAQPGHCYSECQTDSLQYAVCNRPHDSSSGQCVLLYPATNLYIAKVLVTEYTEAAICAAQRNERLEFERKRGSND